MERIKVRDAFDIIISGGKLAAFRFPRGLAPQIPRFPSFITCHKVGRRAALV